LEFCGGGKGRAQLDVIKGPQSFLHTAGNTAPFAGEIMVSIVSLDPEGRSQISALHLTQVSPPPATMILTTTLGCN
jgi:hypothetical protein